MSRTVILKLPVKLRLRIARAARQKGQSAERWMLEAIHHEVERRERFQAYLTQARRGNPLGVAVGLDDRRGMIFEGLSSTNRNARRLPRRMR